MDVQFKKKLQALCFSWACLKRAVLPPPPFKATMSDPTAGGGSFYVRQPSLRVSALTDDMQSQE